MVTVTNCQKLSCFKQHKCVGSGGQKSDMALVWLRSRVSGLCSFLEALRGVYFLSFSAARGRLHFLAHGSCLPSSKPAMVGLVSISLTPFLLLSHLFLWLQPGTSLLLGTHMIRVDSPGQSRIISPPHGPLLNCIYQAPVAKWGGVFTGSQ